jgi:hypothetical protein
MEDAAGRLKRLQDDMGKIESEHHLAGLEPIDLAASQAPMFENLRKTFQGVVEAERDGIVNNLDEFVTTEVQNRLDNARQSVANVLGTGTTIRQGNEVSLFYDNVRSLLANPAGKRHCRALWPAFCGKQGGRFWGRFFLGVIGRRRTVHAGQLRHPQ